MERDNTQLLQIPRGAEKLLTTLQRAGYEAQVVGGCVRDALLGKTPHDWDICTSALPERMVELFSPRHRVIETGIQHGTVTVLSDGDAYEITTYRIDGDYTDKRHPDQVQFTSQLEEDLARRDFTMNAMAYSHKSGLIDPFHGREDLQMGVLRCVGDPAQRFEEDGLRIMRCVRFAATGGFAIAPETEQALYEKLHLLSYISAERLRDELYKLLQGPGVSVEDVLVRYREIVASVVPALRSCFDVPQHNPWHCYDVYRHIAASVGRSKPDLTVRLTMLLHDIGKPACRSTDEQEIDHFHGHGAVSADLAEETLRGLRVDNQMLKTVTELVRIHDSNIPTTERSVRRMIHKIGSEQFARFLDVREADVRAQSTVNRGEMEPYIRKLRLLAVEVLTKQQPVQLSQLAIGGRDLIAQGMAPGPDMGVLLQKLMEAVLEEPARNTPAQLLQYARDWGYLGAG